MELLYVTILKTKQEREKHGGYKYLVARSFCSYVAFRTKIGLKEWMKDRGLTFGKRIRGLYRTVEIAGDFQEIMLGDEERFSRLLKRLRSGCILSNGNYTRAAINDKTHTIYYLNPNCKRETLPYIYP